MLCHLWHAREEIPSRDGHKDGETAPVVDASLTWWADHVLSMIACHTDSRIVIVSFRSCISISTSRSLLVQKNTCHKCTTRGEGGAPVAWMRSWWWRLCYSWPQWSLTQWQRAVRWKHRPEVAAFFAEDSSATAAAGDHASPCKASTSSVSNEQFLVSFSVSLIHCSLKNNALGDAMERVADVRIALT